jgi:LEA14-like dessication related protein
MSRIKLALVAAALSLMVTLGTCQTLDMVFKEPQFSLHSIDLTSISFTGLDLLCKVNVENPNLIDIPFPEIDWELFVNTNSFIKGIIKNKSAIKSRKTTVVDIPLQITYADLAKAVKSLQDAKEVDYALSLGAKFALPIRGEKVFNLEHAGKFPVLKVPTVKFMGINVKNVSVRRLDFELNWEVENRNGFAMEVKELMYNFAVNKSQWAAGKVPGTPRIPPDTKVLVPLTFSINALSMVKDITAIIANGTDITYTCGGKLSLGGGMPLLGDIRMPFNFSGTTRLQN